MSSKSEHIASNEYDTTLSTLQLMFMSAVGVENVPRVGGMSQYEETLKFTSVDHS